MRSRASNVLRGVARAAKDVAGDAKNLASSSTRNVLNTARAAAPGAKEAASRVAREAGGAAEKAAVSGARSAGKAARSASSAARGAAQSAGEKVKGAIKDDLNRMGSAATRSTADRFADTMNQARAGAFDSVTGGPAPSASGGFRSKMRSFGESARKKASGLFGLDQINSAGADSVGRAFEGGARSGLFDSVTETQNLSPAKIAKRAKSGAGAAKDKVRESIGARARSGMDGRAFDYTSSTMNRETLTRAGQRLTDSEYIKSAVVPGMREAFEQAGGRSGMAKRVIGGAAVGGATTGTIGALRGNDFWESSRAGVVGGAGIGMGMQGAAMGRTQSGRELTESMRGQYDIAKGDAARAQAYGDLNDLGWNPNDDGGAEWAERRAAQYQGQSFWENMKQTHRESRSPRGKKTGHYGEKASSARNVNEDPLYQTQDMTGQSDYMQGGVMYGGYTAPMQIGTMHGQSDYMQGGVMHGGYTGPGRNPSDSAPPVKASGAKNISPNHTQGRRGKNPNISKPVDTLMTMEQEQIKSSNVASRGRNRGRRQVN